MLWVDVTENTVIVWAQSLCNLNGFGVLAFLETLWGYMTYYVQKIQLIMYLYPSYSKNVSNKNLKIIPARHSENI